ncbi:MAG: AsmA-like C-terminal domain-containing protein [Robiginitomaculum sp.]|nr:AsmA-like C-terminal domain-containing protein [Robiginitomaculum sp.]
MRTTLLHFFEFAALLIVVLGVIFGILSWQLSKGPIELEFLKSDVESAIIEVFGGKSSRIDTLQADWSNQNKALVIVATDVEVLDANGAIIIAIPRFEAGLDGLALLKGNLAFSRLVVIGGEVSLVRKSDGAIGVGVGSIQQVLSNPKVWVRKQGLAAPLLRQVTANLKLLTIREGTLNLHDFLSGIHWQAPDAEISFARNNQRIDFSANGVVHSNGRSSQLSFQGYSNSDFSNLTATASFQNYIPAQLVPDIGRLAFFNRIQLPVSSSLSITTDNQGLLTNATLDVVAETGQINLPNGTLKIEEGVIKARFDAVSGAISVDSIKVKGPSLSLSMNGKVKGLDPARLIVGEQIDFNLAFDHSWLDLPSVMQGKIDLDAVVLKGSLLPETKVLELSQWDIVANNLKLNGDGKLKWVSAPESNEGYARVRLNGRSSGSAELSEVLAFWPSNAAEGVRTWVKNNMRSAKISDMILQLKVDEPIRGNKALGNDILALSFSFDQVETTYFGTMPPIKSAKGTALLQGNRFDVNLTSGSLMSNDLTSGYVEIPHLYPAGAIAVYGARASGELSDLLYMLDQQPFGYASMYKITPSSVTGTGYVDFQMHRAMRTRVAFKDMKFSAKGTYNNVGAPGLVFGQDISDVEMSFESDQTGLKINGEGLVSDWPSKFVWSENFKAVDEPRTAMSVETRLDVSFFDNIGLPTRDFFGGEIDLKLEMVGNGLMVQEAFVAADLTDSSIDFPGPGWNKKEGSPAKLSFRVFESLPNEYVVEDISLLADGLEIEGKLEFSGETGLKLLELEEARLAGVFDFKANVERNSDGVFQISADIKEADVSMFSSGLLQGRTNSIMVPVQAQINFKHTIAGERLLFDEGYLKYDHNGERLVSLDFYAQSLSGEHYLNISESADVGQKITASSVDGGAVLDALLGLKGLSGGDLQITGEIAGAEKDENNFVLKMQNFRLNNTPVAAQILSLGSLTGLSDTLSGSGIAFNKLVIPIQSKNGFLYIREASATGPAMGITLDGNVDLTERQVHLKGALAPAYTLNSLFKVVPILGNVLVPGEGEGVFGLNFNIEGAFDQMKVSVNPLSAFTPGVLRQMFGGALPDAPVANTENSDPENTETPITMSNDE